MLVRSFHSFQKQANICSLEREDPTSPLEIGGEVKEKRRGERKEKKKDKRKKERKDRRNVVEIWRESRKTEIAEEHKS